MNDVSQVTEVAKGISDYGALVMMAAFYLILSASMMIAIFRWFKSIINTLMEDNKKNLQEVLAETRRQNKLLNNITEGLNDVTEGLKPETQLRIRNLTGFAFDLSVEQICRFIKQVREENHISDKEATLKKITKYVTALHEDRSSRFDTFSYRGTPLSAYCNHDWIEQIVNVIETEVYHPDGANNKRAFTNVKLAYDSIKTDFYHRLNK